MEPQINYPAAIERMAEPLPLTAGSSKTLRQKEAQRNKRKSWRTFAPQRLRGSTVFAAKKQNVTRRYADDALLLIAE